MGYLKCHSSLKPPCPCSFSFCDLEELIENLYFQFSLNILVGFVMVKLDKGITMKCDFETLQVAMTHPMAVTNCNIDMESLISDQNRSIATLAITTLLKTGNESSVDRLMKQITNFMSDIADEFKIVVVEAIRSLCLKFPLKYRSLYVF